MDFFEAWFHLSPDGGNGSWEAAFLMTLGVVAALAIVPRRLWSHIRGTRAVRGHGPAGNAES